MSVSACVLKDFLHRVSCTCNHIVTLALKA